MNYLKILTVSLIICTVTFALAEEKKEKKSDNSIVLNYGIFTNISSVKGHGDIPNVYSFSSSTGYSLGFQVQADFNKWFGVLLHGGYEAKNISMDIEGDVQSVIGQDYEVKGDARLETSFVPIGILLRGLFSVFYIEAGPYYSLTVGTWNFQLNSTAYYQGVENNNTSEDEKVCSCQMSNDYGIELGGGVLLPIFDNISVEGGFRAKLGYAEIYDRTKIDESFVLKQRSYSFHLGAMYQF